MTVTAAETASPTAAPQPTSRTPRSDSWLVTALAILLALFIGGLLIIFSDETVRTDLGYFFNSPGDFFRDAWYTLRDAYLALFEGAIYNTDNDGTLTGIFGPIAATISTATPLICGGLAVSVAFRAGLFNIGAEGQIIAGATASGYVGLAFSLPGGVHLVLAIAAGIAGGALWGFIAGFLKARTGAHEVITTIMLNYVAAYGLLYLLSRKSIQSPGNPQSSKLIHGTARLPHLFGGSLPTDLGVLLAIAAAVGVWWLLTRSTIGFRLRAVGANPAAARTAGMNVAGTTVLALTLSGALAGLGGTTLALGGATSYAVTPNISSNVGFDAITVALLGRCSPWGTIFAGLLFGALRQGGAQMQATPDVAVPIDIVTVIQALIVIFIAAPQLVRAVFRLKGRGRAAFTGATTNLVVTVTNVRAARIPRHLMAGLVEVGLGVAGIWAFALPARSEKAAVFHFSLPGAKVDLGSWTFTAGPVALVLCLLVIAAGVLRLTRRLSARWCAAISILGLLIAFMSWSVAGTASGLNVVSLLQGALFPAAIPLILGALAGVIGERAGVVNVAIEGQLLLSAFAAAVITTVAGSIWLGTLGGMVAGMAVGAVLAVMAIRYLVDQVIIGIVLNILVAGLTSFFFNKMLSPHADEFNTPGYFTLLKIPVLGDIPIIGPVLFHGTIFLYVTYLLVGAVHCGLFHTRWGLRLRSVGEHPRAADTVGINVFQTRYRALLLAGALAGLAGTVLVIGSGSAGSFQLNMSAGKGFIALAAVIFGRWSPVGAVLAALLFGFADQLQSLLAQAGAPIDSNLLLTLPYIATLFAVAGFVGRVRAPAADGQPYTVG
jgi:simple sugar transport system permease protein